MKWLWLSIFLVACDPCTKDHQAGDRRQNSSTYCTIYVPIWVGKTMIMNCTYYETRTWVEECKANGHWEELP
jgi:hypothetical protein